MSGGTPVTVLAPSPILTVTIEDGPEVHVHAGGQGFWAAHMMSEIGVDVIFCAPLGGEVGTALRPVLENAGFNLRLIDTVRSNGAYVHRRRDDEVEAIAEMVSPDLTRHEADDLYSATLAAGMATGFAALTGSRDGHGVEPSFYRRICGDLRANGCRVTADLSGAELDAALAGGVDLLHVNERELAEHAPPGEPWNLREAARRLRREGAREVIVSRGSLPGLALLGRGEFEVVGPSFSPQEHRGTGDSMFAAMTAALAQGETTDRAVRLGAAAGAVNAVRRGLGTGRREEIARLADQIELRPLAEDATARRKPLRANPSHGGVNRTDGGRRAGA